MLSYKTFVTHTDGHYVCVFFNRCQVPEVTVSEPRVYAGRLYRGQPFNASIMMTNASDFPAAYKILPQKEHSEDDLSYLVYSTNSKSEVYIEMPPLLAWPRI